MTNAEKIEELLDSGSLTKWEDSFLTYLSAKVDDGESLTEREQEKLNEIYDQKV